MAEFCSFGARQLACPQYLSSVEGSCHIQRRESTPGGWQGFLVNGKASTGITEGVWSLWAEAKFCPSWGTELASRVYALTLLPPAYKRYYGLNGCVPLTFIYEISNPQCHPVRSGVFGRWFNPEGGALTNGISALMEEIREILLPVPHPPLFLQQENDHLWTRKRVLTRHQIC